MTLSLPPLSGAIPAMLGGGKAVGVWVSVGVGVKVAVEVEVGELVAVGV